MDIPTMNETISLHISRTFTASCARLFQAWTEPAELKQWFGVADGYTTPIAEVDLRVGGHYRLGMQPPGSDQILIAEGIYREILPSAKIVFTWRWETSQPDEPYTLVTVKFHARGDLTEVELTHEQFTTATARDEHAQGWQGCLDRLARTIT
jgi:uncharacterized protein YndB with AHSA1/START domain